MNAKKMLVMSFLANVLLVGLAGHLVFRKPNPPDMTDRSSTVEPSMLAAAQSSHDARPQPVPKPFHWGQLESSDYKTYISNLQAIGCPEQTIRDIITADVDGLYSRKIQRSEDRKREELRQEENNVIVSLLGPPPSAERNFTQAGGESEHTPGPNGGTQGAAAQGSTVQMTTSQGWISQSSVAGGQATQSGAIQDAMAQNSTANGNSSASGSMVWNANLAGAASQISAPQGGAAQNASPQSSANQNGAAAPQRDVRVPLAFQNINASGLNDNQQQVINQIRQDFVNAVGGENADPSTPDYLKSWQNAQRQSDDLIRTRLGQQTFLQDQLRAAQQAAGK